MTDEPTPEREAIGDQVANAVARIRTAQRIPYTELAERLAALDRPIPVLGLRRIERGERRVDVDELVALARALGTSPIALMFPLGHVQHVEVLPGQVADVWAAAKWFTAEGPYPDSNAELEAADRRYPRGHDSRGVRLPTFARQPDAAAAPFELYRAHDQYVSEWARHKQRAALALMTHGGSRDRGRLKEELANSAERMATSVEELISDVLRRMRDAGIALPPVHDARLNHLYL